MRMKRFAFFALIAILSGCAPGAMTPVQEADKTVSQVYEVPGFTKDQIFTATKVWIAETFRSAKAVTEYENQQEGTLIGNGVINYPCSGMDCLAKSDWRVPFTMRVDTKDGKFRLTFTNIRLAWSGSYNTTVGYMPAHEGPVQMQNDMDAIKPKLLAFGDQLTQAIKANAAAKPW